MLESQCENFWCPLGRVSIQLGTKTHPQIEAVATGAFNRAVVYVPGTQAEGKWAYPSRCIGSACAWWRWHFWSRIGLIPKKKRSGYCGIIH